MDANKITELVGSVKKGMMTEDEAAQCLAGHTLKTDPRWEKWIEKGFRTHEGLLSFCRAMIETHRPGFPGIDPDRHWVR